MIAKNISNRLYEHWENRPDHPAIHLIQPPFPDQSLSYAELIEGSLNYAQALDYSGIKPGEIVIIILNHSKNLIFAFWGAILHGAVPAILPFLTEKLSPEQYRKSLVSLLKISSPAAIITYPDFVTEVHLALQALEPEELTVRITLNSQEIPENNNPQWEHVSGLQHQPTDIALLQHSSGSTGLQKGVALSHQSIFNQLESYSRAILLNEKDVIVSWLPLYHDMGLIAGFIMPILTGKPLVLISPFDWVRSPSILFQAVTKYRGTLSWLPNFAFNFCSQKIRPRDLVDIDLSTWRAVINCSEPMYLKSHQMFQEKFTEYGLRADAIATCYAMAENVFAVTQGGIQSPGVVDHINPTVFFNDHLALPVTDHLPSLSVVSAGKPIDNVKIKIFSEDFIDLPERKVGQIAIKSNSLLNEYYRRPDLTEKAFYRGWYLTGDLGYIANNEVYITGRKKDIIIVGGKNIYPQDLENLASEVEGIHPGRVAAFGIQNENAGTEDIVVVAEIEENNAMDLNEISNQLRMKINQGSDVTVRIIKLVNRGWLLKTSSGKVARTANKEKYLTEFI